MFGFLPDKVTFAELPAGEAGVNETLRRMGEAVKIDKAKPMDWYAIRRLALSLVAGLPPKDYVNEARRLHEYVRDRIRYVKDPDDRELVQSPTATLAIGQGDCDDKSVLLAALLKSIGHPARFKAIAVDGDPRFCHVYVETKLGNSWVACETTEPWPLGAYAPRITRFKVWHL